MLTLSQRGVKYSYQYDGNKTAGYEVFYASFSNSITNTVPYDINIDGYFPKVANQSTINMELWITCVYQSGTTFRYVAGTKNAYVYADASNYLQPLNAQNAPADSGGTARTYYSAYNNVSASYAFGDGIAAGAVRLANVGGALYLRLYNSASPAAGSLTNVTVSINWTKV